MAVLKKEFINRMAENGGITKKAARMGFDLFFETLMECMAEGEKVLLVGLGKFEMKTTSERKGKVPLSGAECVIPEHKNMKFYVSRSLNDRIEELQED